MQTQPGSELSNFFNYRVSVTILLPKHTKRVHITGKCRQNEEKIFRRCNFLAEKENPREANTSDKTTK